MQRRSTLWGLLASGLLLGILSLLSHAQPRLSGATTSFSLDSTRDLELIGVKAEAVTYRGRKAVHLVENPLVMSETMALVKNTDFADGTIEVDLSGAPAPNAPEGSRGFIGIVFHSAPDASKFEYIYIRPTNGRADDQLRRNHSTQYASHPGYPWERLRKENPGVYESYADMEPGVWTRIRIVVKGTRAELYVNAATQPCLIVNDLKLGKTHGLIGLWIGQGTEAYFANLKITSAQAS